MLGGLPPLSLGDFPQGYNALYIHFHLENHPLVQHTDNITFHLFAGCKVGLNLIPGVFRYLLEPQGNAPILAGDIQYPDVHLITLA
ncbi:hypothetical protein ES703_122245 [subsurface metagenome]